MGRVLEGLAHWALCGHFRGSVPCSNYCGGLFNCKPVYDACSASGYVCFYCTTSATVVPVLPLPHVDGCIVSFATLLEWLQSSDHSFKINGMCLTFSGVIPIDSWAHTKWRGREHPPAAGRSISLLTPEIVIWNQVLCLLLLGFFCRLRQGIQLKRQKKTWNVT